MTNPTSPRDTSSTFAKGLEVLAAFDGDPAALTLADIARKTGQDRATARRGALTLTQLGYLRQEGRQFSLTPRVLVLSGGFLRANRFGQLVQPVLNRHAARAGIDLTLATLDGNAALLLAQSTAGEGPVTYGFTPGSRLPLLHTSLGRMLLAVAPDATALALISSASMEAHTPQSLTSRSAIHQRVLSARADGYCLTDGEFEPGIAGLAVPVGGSRTVLGCSAPRGKAGLEHQDDLLRGLQTCALELQQTGGLSQMS